MKFISISESYYQEFLKVDQKYLYEVNDERTRQSIIRDYYNLFDRNFIGRFVDKTTPEQIAEGKLNIAVVVNGREMTIPEFCYLMELYVKTFKF